MSIEYLVPRRPHPVSPDLASIRLVLAVKSFATVSHIGLGVTALCNMRILRRAGVQTEVWTCQDEQDLVKRLRREAEKPSPTARRVTHVVISAPSWVMPDTFRDLALEHRDIEFVQQNHSGTSYLSIDKNGIRNIKAVLALQAMTHNVFVGFNNPRGQQWAAEAFGQPYVVLLPNLYDTESFVDPLPPRRPPTTVLRIGSFGASRPWKNQLTAAEAAVQLGRRLGLEVEFYVNSGRPEKLHGGARLIESRLELFEGLQGARMFDVPWATWPAFRQIVRRMDILFSPSFDETFCVVGADGVAEGVPSVVTGAMEWLPRSWYCEPWEPSSVVRIAVQLLHDPRVIFEARELLRQHVARGIQLWLEYLLTP